MKYYEAYDLRYRQVHEKGLAWFGGQPTPIVGEVLAKYGVQPDASMLEIGCGEGSDAAFLLQRGCNLTATDVSPAAITYCQTKYPQWAEHFSVLDCLKDDTSARYDFIYAVAVLHMLVPDEDRQRLLTFLCDHLTEQGVGLIIVMGDGEMRRATDISAAFELQERTHQSSGQTLMLASTSCRIVTREELRGEIRQAGLEMAEMGDTSWDDMPFAMYAVVKKGSASAQ